MATHDCTAEVFTFVKTKLAERLKAPIDIIDTSSSFIDLGLESVDAVLLCGEVEDEFQVELDPSMIFQHETVGGFVTDVVSRLDR